MNGSIVAIQLRGLRLVMLLRSWSKEFELFDAGVAQKDCYTKRRVSESSLLRCAQLGSCPKARFHSTSDGSMTNLDHTTAITKTTSTPQVSLKISNRNQQNLWKIRLRLKTTTFGNASGSLLSVSHSRMLTLTPRASLDCFVVWRDLKEVKPASINRSLSSDRKTNKS